MTQEITCCPHCGSDDGFYTLCDYIKVKTLYNYDGSERDNSEMFSEHPYIRHRRYAYCITCGKVICNASTMDKQLDRLRDESDAWESGAGNGR